jgi:hypothetical protein
LGVLVVVVLVVLVFFGAMPVVSLSQPPSRRPPEPRLAPLRVVGPTLRFAGRLW